MLTGQTIGSGAYRFEIEGELGSGAMGTVYRARFHKDGKVFPVALKFVALGLLGNEGAMARFDREANILKQLRHPHIVKLYATGAYRKAPFIAMEFVDGESLDRVLARRGRLAWEEVAGYGRHLCEALQYAHDTGIIHRDLKPSNLMIGPDGVLKLTDFGIAKDTDVTALTGQNSTIGTAAYMSPEQCKGDKNLTNKSDLYSLGVVFFELLTGRKPFVAETTVDMFLKHVHERPPRVGKLAHDLPGKFEALILQLLEKDKDDRPTDAAWVGRMLREVEEDAQARKSAGLGAVTDRRGGKLRNLDGSTLDDADREATRALRGKKKKAKKKEAVPLLERPAVKAAGIGLVLLAIAAGAFFALRPPSAAKLAREVAEATTTDAKLEAATKYLERHGDTAGETTDEVARQYREAAARKRDEVLTKRFVNKWQKPDEADDREAYEAAWQAMEAERGGSFGQAEEFWRKVKARFPDEAKLPFTLKDEVKAKAQWGWVADRRLADLGKARQLAETVRRQAADRRRNEAAFSADRTTPEPLALRAFRLEEFGDREKAGPVWDALAALTEKDADKRDWFLLACQQRAPSPKSSDATARQRAERIEVHLKDAAEAAGRALTDPLQATRARILFRDVIDLYDDEPDPKLKGYVEQARKLAAAVPKS
jgi:serine/threonine-protein kinase